MNCLCRVANLVAHSRLGLDYNQSLFFFRLSEGCSCARERRAAAREEKKSSFFRAFPVSAFSHACGHLRVSLVLLDVPRKKRETRSLV